MEDYAEQAHVEPADPSYAKYWFGGQILFCIGLIVLSLYVVIESIRFSIPYLDRGDATFFDMPGLSPILASLLLILLSVLVIRKSAALGGKASYYFSRDFVKALGGTEARLVCIVFGTLVVYVFLLFPYLHYALATLIYLVGFMALLKLCTWRSILASAIFAAALWFVFGYLFSINLPN